MKGSSKISDFDKIFVCLFVASYPYTLHPFVCLVKDLVLVSGEGLYKMI